MQKIQNIILTLFVLFSGIFCFLIISRYLDKPIAINSMVIISGLLLIVLILGALLFKFSKSDAHGISNGTLLIVLLAIMLIILGLSTAYNLSPYLSLPVDLLSFSESPFVNEILKIKLGESIYTTPQDNNSYPYTPGAPVLTYFIASVLGFSESISAFRIVQFFYVIFAAFFGASICDMLIRQTQNLKDYLHRNIWMIIWFFSLFLIATEPNINRYIYTLHNDGLSILISMLAFWLLVRYSQSPKRWIWVSMIILPSAGFLVKQSLLMWTGIFWLYLLLNKEPWKKQIQLITSSVLLTLIIVAACYSFWGNNFKFWIFEALGDKSVSILRSLLHMFDAGFFVIMGLIAGWTFVFNNKPQRKIIALWLAWLVLILVEIYTSGIGWQANHLGPGIMIASCWFFVAIFRYWPERQTTETKLKYRLKELTVFISAIGLFGALNLIREPVASMPQDIHRYIAQIEDEFNGFSAKDVLLDNGTWIYFHEGVLMKDRSSPVALNVGKNQSFINHEMLSETIRRIREKKYLKILAHHIEPGPRLNTWYDYQDVGSGVKSAILDNYELVRKIPGVKGVYNKWWLKGLIADVWVFIPKPDSDASEDSSTNG